MSSPPSRRRFWLLAALLLAAAAVGAGVAVHADYEARPPIAPYDPLTRW